MSVVDRFQSVQKPWFSLLICLLAGALTPFSFAPYNVWFVSVLSVAVLALVLLKGSGKQCFLHAFAFALGYYAMGVSWVYISIYYFGSASFLLASLLTALFIIFVAIVFAVPFYMMRWVKRPLRLLVGFPLIWVLSEWCRTWFLTGFPWLFLGYSHLDQPLSGWAPIGGVLLISLWGALSSGLLAQLVSRASSLKVSVTVTTIVLAIWGAGYGLRTVQWTEVNGDTISIGMVQANIPQEHRWDPEYRDIIEARLRHLSRDLWGKDWIVWPEAALPHLYHQSQSFIDEIYAQTQRYNTVVITGVLYDTQETEAQTARYYNSVVGIGDVEGIYHKRRLVPFGEYVPLESFIRGLIAFFDLPLSIISSGDSKQGNLRIGPYSLANAICYEIVYPALVAEQAQGSNVLLTISNDAWFGRSIGPLQHFQMVRMRALETGRYIIRSTNNGVSAIIAPDGKVQQRSQQFVMAATEGQVKPMVGTTPYMYWKNYLVLGLLLFMALFVLLHYKATGNKPPRH